MSIYLFVRTLIMLRGPLHRLDVIEQSKFGPISQRSLKSNERAISVGDPCALVDLLAISPLGWQI